MAGLIDGEGCLDFGIVKTRQEGYDRRYIIPRVRITLTKSSRFLLENIQNNYGGILTDRPTTNPRWKDTCVWTVQGKKILGLLQNVKKHLILKGNQADFLCQYIKNFASMRFEQPDIGQKFREQLRSELKALKTDPHRLSDPARFYREAIVEMPDTVKGDMVRRS